MVSEGWPTQYLGRSNVLVWVWRQGKNSGPSASPVKQKEFSYSWKSSAFLFYSALQLTGWGPRTWGRVTALFSLLIYMLISSKNTLAETSRIMFDQISGHPMAHSSWHIKLSIADRQWEHWRHLGSNLHIKRHLIYGTSLVVQWVRLRTPNVGGPGSIPGQVTRSHMHAITKKSPCRN